MNEKELIEKIQSATAELKSEIVKLMFDFTNKYSVVGENCIYPYAGNILVNVLVECLSDAEYQVKEYAKFTPKQMDHICYQIGKWYLIIKPLLEGQHNLGHMKEKLKTMICGNE